MRNAKTPVLQNRVLVALESRGSPLAPGSGPFARASIIRSLLATQLFVAVAALTSLVLAAVTAERSASERPRRQLAAEQPALRRIATLVGGRSS
jgi:hypothetical protein